VKELQLSCINSGESCEKSLVAALVEQGLPHQLNAELAKGTYGHSFSKQLAKQRKWINYHVYLQKRSQEKNSMK